MSITIYFMPRSTKVIDDEITHHTQSLPFRILGINNSHPRQLASSLVNKDKQDSTSCSKLSQSQTLPIKLANAEEREEQENKKENKAAAAPKKPECPSQGTAHTLLIALTNLMKMLPARDLSMMTMMMLSQTLYELCVMKWKVMERKECLWQLLMQRSAGAATPIILVAVGLSSSAPFATTT